MEIDLLLVGGGGAGGHNTGGGGGGGGIFYGKSIILEAGNYKAVIDQTYPLEEIVEATKYVELAQKIGNVVITV